MSQRKVTDLTDMVIKEVSLVIDPASIGADVILTKARDVADEPRDERGRWTTATAAARAHAKVLSGHAKRMAIKAFNQVKGSSVAITSTRPHAAKPVHGGGVQFEFRHTLGDGTRYVSSVQIRPEHLDRIAGAPQPGAKPSRLHRALGAIHTALNRAGVALVRPFGTPPQPGERGFGGMLRVNRAPLSAAEQEEKSFQDKLANVRLNRRRDEELRAAGGGGGYTYASSSSPTNISAAARPVSPMAPAPTQGVRGTGHGGIPTYDAPSMPPDQTANAWKLRPEGHGQTTEIEGGEKAHLPLPSSTAYQAGGWAHYTPQGDFIPTGRPDIQEHMEAVAQWRRSDSRAPSTVASMTSSHQKSGGRAYFTSEGEYVPAGTNETQRRMESRYEREQFRLVGDAPDVRDERTEAAREPSMTSTPHRLFDAGNGQTVTEDTARQRLDLNAPWEPKPGEMDPATGQIVPIRRMPDDPALEGARGGNGQRSQWGVSKSHGSAQPLNFYTSAPSPEKVRKNRLAYVKSVTKSVLVG